MHSSVIWIMALTIHAKYRARCSPNVPCSPKRYSKIGWLVKCMYSCMISSVVGNKLLNFTEVGFWTENNALLSRYLNQERNKLCRRICYTSRWFQANYASDTLYLHRRSSIATAMELRRCLLHPFIPVACFPILYAEQLALVVIVKLNSTIAGAYCPKSRRFCFTVNHALVSTVDIDQTCRPMTQQPRLKSVCKWWQLSDDLSFNRQVP